MNQILYTIEDENRDNRMKSIVLFFCIFLIVFGLALTGVGGYNIYASNIKKQERIELAKIPQIKLNTVDNQVVINVEHVRVIKDIVYSWNNEEEETLVENKSSGINEYIDIPSGNNTLFVKVTDVNGIYSTTEGEFSYKGTYIDPSLIDNKKIKIVATDNEGLQSLSYKWNSEEPAMKEAESINNKRLEMTADIPIGHNTITITAVNNKNEITKKEMEVQGITKPTIRVNYNSDKTLFTIRLKDDQGIESYTYRLSSAKVEDIAENNQIKENFKEKLVKETENTVQGNAELEITDKLALVEGFNYLEIKVRNIEGAEETLTGWCAK